MNELKQNVQKGLRRKDFLKLTATLALGGLIGFSDQQLIKAADYNGQDIIEDARRISANLEKTLKSVYSQLKLQKKMDHYSIYENILTQEAYKRMSNLFQPSGNEKQTGIRNELALYMPNGGVIGHEGNYGVRVGITCMDSDTYTARYQANNMLLSIADAIITMFGFFVTGTWSNAYSLLFSISCIITSFANQDITNNYNGNARNITTEVNGEMSSVLVGWDTYPYQHTLSETDYYEIA